MHIQTKHCCKEAQTVRFTTALSSLSQASLPSLLINEGKPGRGGNGSSVCVCGQPWPGHTAAGVLRAVLSGQRACRGPSHVTGRAAERAGTWTGTETAPRGTLHWRLRPCVPAAALSCFFCLYLSLRAGMLMFLEVPGSKQPEDRQDFKVAMSE